MLRVILGGCRSELGDRSEHDWRGYGVTDQRLGFPTSPYVLEQLLKNDNVEARLMIEADGGQHSDQVAYDVRRTVRLEGMGYLVMRFLNHAVPCGFAS